MSASTNKLVPPAPILLAYMYFFKKNKSVIIMILLFVLQLEHGFDLIVSRMS